MCFYSLVLGPFSTFIQNRLLLKTIVMYGGCLCFLKVNYPGNSWLRIAAAFVINIIISGFVEFLSLSLHFLVSRERYDFANRYIVPGYVYVLQLLMSVFALTACIRLFAKKTFVTNRIVICQFCLCAVQALICFYLCYCFYMERVVADVEVDIFICCTLLVSSILLYGYLIRSCQKKQREQSMQALRKIYEEQLQLYMQLSDNEENYQEFRHDLINFLLSSSEGED